VKTANLFTTPNTLVIKKADAKKIACYAVINVNHLSMIMKEQLKQLNFMS
jgi:hypothetical protein